MGARKFDWKPVDLGGIKTVSLYERQSKVSVADFAHPMKAGGSFGQFMESLPAILAAKDLVKAVSAISEGARNGKTLILGMGAHPIKVGLNPLIIEAMERGVFSGVAMNGAGMIHDVEIALAGKTSEDVAAHLGCGQFGMARETAEFILRAVSGAFASGGQGLGRSVGKALLEQKTSFANLSILAAAARCNLPVTVHVAIGTDIVHMHPEMDGAAMGALTHYDFRLFCSLVSTLESGVFINLGSAVIIPEVFLKAASVVRNLGFSLRALTTVNMDFLRQYRPLVNVVQRPTMEGGLGINLTGHHEIMFPLLLAAVFEQIEGQSRLDNE